MSDLKTNLEQILQEKETKIIPENIKKDIQIFDITGTYEGNSGDVKLFETEEAMQADPNTNQGDLAVVYKSKIQNMTSDTQTQYITFPQTVTLPSVITESYRCRLRATDPSKMFDGNIMLDQNAFQFDGFTNTGMIRVSYTSSDGITYTREEFMEDSEELTNPVDLSVEIYCEIQEEWNDNFGYFMQIEGNVFEGLYEYDKNNLDKTKLNLVNASSVTVNYNEGSPVYNWDGSYNSLIIDRIKLEKILEKIKSDLRVYNVRICIKDNKLYFYTLDRDYIYITALYYNTNNEYIGLTVRGSSTIVGQDCPNLMVYSIDLDTISYSLVEQIAPKYLRYTTTDYFVYFDWKPDTFPKSLSFYNMDNIDYNNYTLNVQIYYEGTSDRVGYKVLQDIKPEIFELNPKYILAPTQLTLAASNELLPGKIAYGKNGVVTGDDTIYDNIPWNDEIFSKIDTNIVLSGLGSMCTGMYNSRSINNSLVANKFLTPTSGTSDICLNFDFDHTAVLDYAKREFDENSFYNFMVIDNYVIYTFNKHNMGDFTNMTTYLVINNLETNQISSITIPDTFDGYWYNCYPVKDLATNKIYYLIGSGDCGADISQATTTQCLGYELNLDNLTATKVIDVELDLYYYVGYVVYNGKFYISYYNDIEQYNYIYKIENMNEKTLLWSFDSIASYEYWNYKFSYLAPYSIIQKEDKIYFAAFYSNVLSYLYELDMTNNTVTQKVSLQTISDNSSINLLYNGFMMVEDENNNDILYIVLMIKNADSDEIGYRINVGKYVISSNTVTMSSYTPTTGPLRPAEDTSYIAYINDDKLVIKVNVWRPTAEDIYTYTYNTTDLSGSVTLSTDEHGLEPSRWYCQRQIRNGTLYVLGQGFSYKGQVIILKNSSLLEGDSPNVKLLRKNGTDEQYTLYSIDLIKNVNTGVLTEEEYNTALSTAKQIEGSE